MRKDSCGWFICVPDFFARGPPREKRNSPGQAGGFFQAEMGSRFLSGGAGELCPAQRLRFRGLDSHAPNCAKAHIFILPYALGRGFFRGKIDWGALWAEELFLPAVLLLQLC